MQLTMLRDLSQIFFLFLHYSFGISRYFMDRLIPSLQVQLPSFWFLFTSIQSSFRLKNLAKKFVFPPIFSGLPSLAPVSFSLSVFFCLNSFSIDRMSILLHFIPPSITNGKGVSLVLFDRIALFICYF